MFTCNIQTEITVILSKCQLEHFSTEVSQSLPSGMYENVTWCKLAGNSPACHLKSAQDSCRYFGLFFYKQKDTMKWRFDKQTVLSENLEITSGKKLFTSVFNRLAYWWSGILTTFLLQTCQSTRAPPWRSVWLQAKPDPCSFM